MVTEMRLVDERRVQALQHLVRQRKSEGKRLMASDSAAKKQAGQFEYFFGECIEYVMSELGLGEMDEKTMCLAVRNMDVGNGNDGERRICATGGGATSQAGAVGGQ